MANKEREEILKNGVKVWQKWRMGNPNILLALCLIPLLLAACGVFNPPVPSTAVEVDPSPTPTAISTVTLSPTLTSIPPPTSTPSDSLGTIALDFIALLCNADWMNGIQHITACPDPTADQSGGYATTFNALSEELPVNTPILLMVPNANALFLRYPSFKVGATDRFRTTLRCVMSAPCDVQFALEYYDTNGQYRGFMEWDYKTGDLPIDVDVDLSALAGQSVDFVLTLRLFHMIESPKHDNGLWIAPHIYRPIP
jgi:hypothetical protein